MLEKSSIFLMLLLGAGSLIGISSIYKPANVETQPQQQQQQQLVPPGQIQKQPPIVTQQQPQSTTGKIITQQRAETLAQATEDKMLLDRLFPQIIKRIDGNTLLQKIDAKTLAAKVLPYLDISATVNPRSGPTLNYDAPADVARDLGLTGQEPARSSTAGCNEGETAVGGGFRYSGDPQDDYLSYSEPDEQNHWISGAVFTEGGTIQASVTCLTINVGLKNVQQPQQPLPPPLQPPSQQPSGGPIVR